jgi:hypothetical protein
MPIEPSCNHRDRQSAQQRGWQSEPQRAARRTPQPPGAGAGQHRRSDIERGRAKPELLRAEASGELQQHQKCEQPERAGKTQPRQCRKTSGSKQRHAARDCPGGNCDEQQEL